MKTRGMDILVVLVDIGSLTMGEKAREKRTLGSSEPMIHEKVLISAERSPHCEQ